MGRGGPINAGKGPSQNMGGPGQANQPQMAPPKDKLKHYQIKRIDL
jgi:hypothetical protein